MGVGYGVFTETIGPVVIKDNMLVNMGESYIVTNLHQDELTEQEKYDHFLLAQAQAEEEMQLGGPKAYNLHLPPPKLKLRVFSVSKSSNPDLYCCEYEE